MPDLTKLALLNQWFCSDACNKNNNNVHLEGVLSSSKHSLLWCTSPLIYARDHQGDRQGEKRHEFPSG